MSDAKNWFTAPDVREGYVCDVFPVRWHPYKPAHTEKTGRKGRWQRMNEYGGWDNCEPPGKIFPDFIDPTSLEAENKRLREFAEWTANRMGGFCVDSWESEVLRRARAALGEGE